MNIHHPLKETINETISDEQEMVLWQTRLLPIMKRMIVVLTIFFLVASLGQLTYLQVSINNSPKIDIYPVLSSLQTSDKNTLGEKESAVTLKATILLETNTMERRHHEANVLLMSSVWVRYLGFTTGMILAFIGAIFILGKLQEKNSEIGGKIEAASVTLKSSSPGIILVVLGAALMIITIVMQHTIQVNDAAIYLDPGKTAAFTSGGSAKPIIHLPSELDSNNHSK
jgi:hypothetical protein